MYNHYQEVKELAATIRDKYQLVDTRILPSKMKKICKSEGILYIDLSDKLKKTKGAYFYNEDDGASIIVKKKLPRDPYVFTLAHELKHHLKDRDRLVSCCLENSTKEIEVGAEIFAAELIFPDNVFFKALSGYGETRGSCKPESIVKLKRETDTTLSYSGLVKKAEFLGFVERGAFSKIKWRKLEEEIYGEPDYKKYLKNK